MLTAQFIRRPGLLRLLIADAVAQVVQDQDQDGSGHEAEPAAPAVGSAAYREHHSVSNSDHYCASQVFYGHRGCGGERDQHSARWPVCCTCLRRELVSPRSENERVASWSRSGGAHGHTQRVGITRLLKPIRCELACLRTCLLSATATKCRSHFRQPRVS